MALAVSQATEIVGRPGVHLVGLLPESLNIWTPYAAARVRPGETARGEFARVAFVG